MPQSGALANYDKLGLKGFSKSLPSWARGDTSSSSLIGNQSSGAPKAVIARSGEINSRSGSSSNTGNANSTSINYVPASGFPPNQSNDTNNNNNNYQEEVRSFSKANHKTKDSADLSSFSNSSKKASNIYPTLIMAPNPDEESSETEPLRPNARDEPNGVIVGEGNGGGGGGADTLSESLLLNPGPLTAAPPTPTSGAPLRRQWLRSIGVALSDSVNDDDPPGSASSDSRELSLSLDAATTAPRDGTKAPSLSKKIIRWVGVHHSPHSAPPRRANSTDLPSPDNSLASPPCTPSLHSPSSPVTPHIVVSEEGDEDFPDGGGVENFGDAELNIDNNEDFSSRASNNKMCRSTEDLTGSRSDLSTKVQMTPDMGQSARHNSISSYLAPEVELSLQRKTRRNSMIGMIHRASSVNNLNLSPNQQQHLARVASAGNLRHGASRTSLSPSNGDWRREGNDSMIACLSALYGKILVVMGLAFPIGEFISGEMPLYIYKGFYLYLHLGSIAFLVYAYMFLLQVVPLPKVELKSRLQNFRASTADLGRRLSAMGVNLLQPYNADKSRSSGPRGDVERGVGGGGEDARSVNTLATFQNSKNYTITESTHESMYLKMGAMVFGIGSMIYSGLEVGQYFDLKSTAECADILLVISPVSRMLFTFIQMYFIFLNSRVAINKHRTIARFGLMHMIATNLCIWLNVLVEETKHEIHSLTHASSHGGEHHGPEDYDELYGHGLGNVIAKIADTALRNGTAMLATAAHGALAPSHDDEQGFIPEVTGHHIVRRATDYGAEHPTSMYDCRRSDMMSRLVDNASPFLFPCTIEYSLLCSGVLYVIWKNINKSESNCGGDRDSDISTFIARKARHHYSVDCAHATRGLFMGILVLVLTIISLILFFVLINNENTKSVAVLEANIIELSVYSVAILTVIIGMIQMRELEFVEDGDIELDNILLLIAQTGTYIYTSFTIIGGNFSLDSGRILPFFTAVITLIQTTLQTLFILNASRRCCYNYDQLTRKPGREMVTFLLICNLAMWAISTFETSRADAHPTQLNYYGVWAWTIISHVSMPLAIFYRFHVTVCLCEIWKRSYKLKNDFL